MSNEGNYRIPMHRGGRLVTLDDILQVVNGTRVVWHLMDIEAISMRDSGLDVLQLEREVQHAPGGKVFTDRDLRASARQLDQVIKCKILGVIEGLSFDVGSAVVVEILALDSTEWVLWTDQIHDDRIDVGSPLFEEL